MVEEALLNAAEFNKYMSINGKPKGPFYGPLISVKKHIFLAETPVTFGFIVWADNISTSDALIVELLRDTGAVFHVKTTNPQGLMVSRLLRIFCIVALLTPLRHWRLRVICTEQLRILITRISRVVQVLEEKPR